MISTPIRSFLKAFVVVFFPFSFVFLPYSPNFLPNIHVWFGKWIHWVLQIVGNMLNVSNMPLYDRVYSDSSGHYLLTLVIFFLSLLTAFVLMQFRRWKPWSEKTAGHFKIVLTYLLSFYLFKYGIDKVFLNQFPEPSELNLYTEFGQRTKDITYWNLMGVSGLYVFVSGIAEMLCSMLLWFRKTRSLGYLLSVLILFHVVLVNFSFDITVKLFSLTLLALALYLSYRSMQRVFRVLANESVVQSLSSAAIESPNRPHTNLVKALLIACLVIEASWPFVFQRQTDKSLEDNTTIYGVWRLVALSNQAESPSYLPFEKIILRKGGKSLIIREGRILETQHAYVPQSQILVNRLDGTDMYFQVRFATFEEMSWKSIRQQDTIEYLFKRQGNKDLPIQGKGFNWTLDSHLEK